MLARRRLQRHIDAAIVIQSYVRMRNPHLRWSPRDRMHARVFKPAGHAGSTVQGVRERPASVKFCSSILAP